MMEYEARSLEQRILPYIEPVTESGCWIWMRGVNYKGYGRVMWKGKAIYVHRLLFEIERGPIPISLVTDHLCRVRLCVNPYHIELVTHKENALRGIGPTAINASKTHCIHGHEFTSSNTRVYCRNGHIARACKACRIINDKRRSLRNARLARRIES